MSMMPINPSSTKPVAADETALLVPGAQKPASAQPGMQRVEEHEHWPLLSRVPLRLTAGVPIVRFKVGDLLALAAGVVVPTSWPSTEDVPLRMGQVLLSWSEFEVVEGRMAVRLTRLG